VDFSDRLIDSWSLGVLPDAEDASYAVRCGDMFYAYDVRDGELHMFLDWLADVRFLNGPRHEGEDPAHYLDRTGITFYEVSTVQASLSDALRS
jgi:hypothetical protein